MTTEIKQNFLSIDKQVARNSYGDFFTIGEEVSHDDETVGVATILTFNADLDRNEVRVITTKGYAYLDYLKPTEK